jgi:hypothetical protein
MTLVVGTKGLAPDEGLLTRHGHRRRVSALRNYLAQLGVASWSKADPAAISTKMPEAARRRFPSCAAVFDRYGEVIYSAAWIPRGDAAKADAVVRAYFDRDRLDARCRVRENAIALRLLGGLSSPSRSTDWGEEVVRRVSGENLITGAEGKGWRRNRLHHVSKTPEDLGELGQTPKNERAVVSSRDSKA